MSINAVSLGGNNPTRVSVQAASTSEASASVGSASRQSMSVDYSKRVDNLKGIVDPSSGVFVLQQREGATGEVKNQYPSKQVVAAYTRTDVPEKPQSAPSQPAQPVQSSSETSQSAAPVAVAVSTPSTNSAPVSTGTTSVDA